MFLNGVPNSGCQYFSFFESTYGLEFVISWIVISSSPVRSTLFLILGGKTCIFTTSQTSSTSLLKKAPYSLVTNIKSFSLLYCNLVIKGSAAYLHNPTYPITAKGTKGDTKAIYEKVSKSYQNPPEDA